jgi:AcrR family transcriptional regulator
MVVAARPYHHHDLPAALLDAVDALVREDGAGAVTLRAAARRAGVSHAAPAHHFGDKAGLLAAYAIQGLAALRERLTTAGAEAAAAGEPALLALGLAYVRFAVEEPGRFALMFGPKELHGDRPGYQHACNAAFDVLMDAVRELRTDLDPHDADVLRAAAGAWSLVHGFATLWLNGNLAEEITSPAPGEAAAAAFAAFATTLLTAVGVKPDRAELGPWQPRPAEQRSNAHPA